MARHESQPGTSSGATPPHHDPYSGPLTAAYIEDSEEWEYEYSSKETEVVLLLRRSSLFANQIADILCDP
jgi:hypothetical protein